MGVSPSAYVGWAFTCVPALLLGLIALALVWRRTQIRCNAQNHAELIRARQHGSHVARLQHPKIDLAQCIGCGSCVRACPEDGVLSLLRGGKTITLAD